jgi:hypothetical protein
METGSTFTDGTGVSWQVGQELARGLFHRSFVVRSQGVSGGTDAGYRGDRVLKVPLTRADFGDASLPDDALAACVTAIREQAALYSDAAHPFLPPLVALLEIEGRPALMLPRYAATLATRLASGHGLSSVIQTVAGVTQSLTASGFRHGNLRPANLLIGEADRIVLDDPITPALVPHARRLHNAAPKREDWWPPNAVGTPQTDWDTWALCQILHRAATVAPDAKDPRRAVFAAPPQDGLDKVELAALRDRTIDLLRREEANPRFASRVADRLASLLNRGLSKEHAPSPPYRFTSAGDLRQRLEELAALVDPTIESVGKLLLGSAAKGDVFEGGSPVALSVSVGSTAAEVGHEDLVLGMQIRDLDDPDKGRVPLPDTQYDVKTHPSGRLRFEFRLPDMAPGRYSARVAFAIKDSGREPVVSDCRFEVRPPPGYVPPPVDHPPDTGAIQFRPAARSTPAVPLTADPPSTPSFAADTNASLPDAEVFPLPVAPTVAEPPFDSSAAPQTFVASDVSDIHGEFLGHLGAPTDHGPATQPSPIAPPSDPGPDPLAPPVPRPPVLAAVPTAPTPDPEVVVPAAVTPIPAVAPALRPAEPSSPSWSGPGQWEELPAPETTDYGSAAPSELLPHADLGQDLPTWDNAEPGHKARSAGALIDNGIELLRDNPYVAFVVVAGGLVLLLGTAGIMLRVCAG